MSEARHLFLGDESATQALAAALAASQPGRAVVFLRGELGAGKSTLARAWLRALGVTGAIRSPTYTLVEQYPLPGDGKAVHLDLYRIGDAGASLWLVEWPARGAAALPAADLLVSLAIDGDGRSATLSPGTATGAEWLARVVFDGQLQPLPESAQQEGAAGHG